MGCSDTTRSNASGSAGGHLTGEAAHVLLTLQMAARDHIISPGISVGPFCAVPTSGNRSWLALSCSKKWWENIPSTWSLASEA